MSIDIPTAGYSNHETLRLKLDRQDCRIVELEETIKRLRDAFRHTHVNDAGGLQPDRCWQCGLDIRDAIHGKALEDVVVGENLFHEASLQSAVKSLIDTVEKSRNDQGGGK